MICTVLAMILANSRWSQTYEALLQSKLIVGVAGHTFAISLQHLINDGLMAIFFFLVGLEIKREILIGELAQIRQALLPISSAIGGMLVPALIYSFFNYGSITGKGWGIPMATDIAFALGVLSLLGDRIPRPLISLLLALAIVDDLGAVLVIAVFYTESLNLPALALAGAVSVALLCCNLAGNRSMGLYAALGLLLWLAMYHSGVHATLAGVITAMAIPARSAISSQVFADKLGKRVQIFLDDSNNHPGEFDSRLDMLRNQDQQTMLKAMKRHILRIESPLVCTEQALHPLVAFGIMPIFALANAGIPIDLSGFGQIFSEPVSLGVFGGLVLGKVIGVFGFSWACIALQLSRLPEGVQYPHLFGMAILSGIGFTMSIFIGNLAFADMTQHLQSAKLGIVTASLTSGLAGFFWLYRCRP